MSLLRSLIRTSCSWNPVKELKGGDLFTPELFTALMVESGEGIESRHARGRPREQEQPRGIR